MRKLALFNILFGLVVSLVLFASCTESEEEFGSLEVTTLQPEVSSGQVSFRGEISGREGATYRYGFLVFDQDGGQTQMNIGIGSGDTPFSVIVTDLVPNDSYIVCAFVEQESESSSERLVGADIPFEFLP